MLDAATKVRHAAHIGVADALCYLMGALGVILTCALIGPKLPRRADALSMSLDAVPRLHVQRMRGQVDAQRLGYSGAVEIAHVLLTTWGTVMVLVMR